MPSRRPARQRRPGWHGVELRHLTTLQAVAAEQSFSAAAARLGYTQSAISGHILALERVIGTRVFERIRGARPVQLTPEGQVLLAHAVAIRARLDAAQSEITALRGGNSGKLRLGSFGTVCRAIIPETLSRLTDEDPAADFELRESYSLSALLEQVEQGKLDLAFNVLPVPRGPFATAEIYRDEHVLVTRMSDPLAKHDVVSLSDLVDVPLIAIEDCRAQSATEAAIAALGQPLNVVRRLKDVASILAFVSAGLGVGFVPARAADLPSDLVAVRIDATVPPRVIAIVWHREMALSHRATRFVEIAAQVGLSLSRKPSLHPVS